MIRADRLLDLIGERREQRLGAERVEPREQRLDRGAQRLEGAAGARGVEQALPCASELGVGGGEQLRRAETVGLVEELPVRRTQLIADERCRFEALHLVQQPLRRVLHAVEQRERPGLHEIAEVGDDRIGGRMEIARQHGHRCAERRLGRVVQLLVDDRLETLPHLVDEPDDFVGDRLERQRSERLDDGIDGLPHLIDRGRYVGTAQDAGNPVNHVLQGVDDHGGIERIERVRHRIDRRARAFAGRLEGPRDVTLDLIAELGDLRAELVAQIVEPDARDRVSDLGERRLHAHADARELRLDVGGEGARICCHLRDLRLHAAEVEQPGHIVQPVDHRLHGVLNGLNRLG